MNQALRSRLTIIVACCCFCCANQPANAVVITLKDGKRIGCWIIQKGKDEVIIDVVGKDGARDRQVIKRNSVDDVDYAVSATRLAELKPSKPITYKRYAEELAQITIDPEARPMSLRLYHIALTLNPDEMRDSCLLGMIGVARNKTEERRFRAAAFLYRSTPDRSILSSTPASVQNNSDADKEDEAILRVLRELRTRKRIVVRPNEIPLLRKTLAPFTDALTDKEISELFLVNCQQCQNGEIDCPNCDRGVIIRGTRRIRCTQCNRGNITCPTCNSRSGRKALPDDLVRRIVSAEIGVVAKRAEAGATQETADDDTVTTWSQIKDRARKQTVPALDLRNLTEFDPTKCLFRNGQWVSP